MLYLLFVVYDSWIAQLARRVIVAAQRGLNNLELDVSAIVP
jgi:hypothetical protein